MIYLDSAATAKHTNIDDIIIDTMVAAMKDSWMNPSSLYAIKVKNKIDKCRSNIAKFIGARTDEIYFTSGASESNNWAIKGWTDWANNNTGNDKEDFVIKMPYFITTPTEHKSILELSYNLYCTQVHMCKVNEFGEVDCDSLENILNMYEGEHILVSVNMANNEIGTLHDIKKISGLVHKYGGVLHTDATQAFGHIPFDVEELGIDMMSCSGHKISPVLRGIGFLYKKNGINIHPLIYGTQENGLRGGTENTYGIIGLSKALEYCSFSSEIMKEMIDKRNYLINSLESKFGCKLNGHNEHRLLNNINVTFPQNITGESLLYMLDLSNVKISVGSACNSHSITSSHVLKAIGLSDEEAMKTIRITLPDDITYDEINYVIGEIEKAIRLIEIN